MRSKASLVLLVVGSLALLLASADQLRSLADPPAPVLLHLAPPVATPGVRVHVAGSGFRPGETVEVIVTESPDMRVNLGQIEADGHGGVGMDLAAGEDATNGDHVVSVFGVASGSTSSTHVTVAGAVAGLAAAGEPRWRMFRIDTAACGPCVFVHGDAP